MSEEATGTCHICGMNDGGLMKVNGGGYVHAACIAEVANRRGGPEPDADAPATAEMDDTGEDDTFPDGPGPTHPRQPQFVQAMAVHYVGFDDTIDGDEAAMMLEYHLFKSQQAGCAVVAIFPFRDGVMVVHHDPGTEVPIPDATADRMEAASNRVNTAMMRWQQEHAPEGENGPGQIVTAQTMPVNRAEMSAMSRHDRRRNRR